MIKRIASFLLLVAAWLLWSGHYSLDPKHLKIAIFGLCSCLFVEWISIRMDKIAGDEDPYTLGIRPLFYIPWLLWEIVKANLDITRIVLSRDLPISPRLIKVKASQKTELGKVIYANSITLTPGTITLDVRNNTFLVHALTRETAKGVLTGEMDRKVCALEGTVPQGADK